MPALVRKGEKTTRTLMEREQRDTDSLMSSTQQCTSTRGSMVGRGGSCCRGWRFWRHCGSLRRRNSGTAFVSSSACTRASAQFNISTVVEELVGFQMGGFPVEFEDTVLRAAWQTRLRYIDAHFSGDRVVTLVSGRRM